MRPYLRLLMRSAALTGSVLPFLPFTEWPTTMACVSAVSPFVSLSAALGGRHLALVTLACLPLIILAFLKHRWFCWNLCPTGFILELTSLRQRPKEHLAAGFPHLGKWLLVFGIGMATAGYPLLIIFDPLSILSGFLSTLQWRNIEWEVFAPVLPLLGLIVLNAIRPNLWCHRLCPLGATQQFLGMAGRRFHRRLAPPQAGQAQCSGCSPSFARKPYGPACNAMRSIAGRLPQGGMASEGSAKTRPSQPETLLRRSRLPRAFGRGASPAEEQAVEVNESAPPTGVKRRFFLMALFGGIAGWALIKKKSGAAVIRPPGAVNESIFTGLCSRCGNCINVCPESIIIPDFGSSGLCGLLTPILKYNHGYCNEWCSKCLDSCPTSAIRRLSLEQKRITAIGNAQIDKALCLAWSNRQDCLVCQEFCPYQAIAIVENGGVNCPEVKEWICRGCGACENQCPAIPRQAIVVQAIPSQKIIEANRYT